MKELIKLVAILIGYLGVAPLLGLAIRNNRRAQQWLFGLMVFMTSWHINKITLMLHSIERYRGHTKGFEFSAIEVIAIALLIATFASRERLRRWIAPGAGLYLLYVAMS